MKARIYRPARNAMQSGTANTKNWVLEFTQSRGRDVDPLMGWTSSADTQTQVRMSFPTKEAALEYAEEHGIEATVMIPKPRKPNIRPRGYGENFVPDRRVPWTH
ncbi:ETC complex I subunit conserved region [Salinihabitans flavidus]|uniref:ETC complex I subunit conserved region n=1 Tax=Salinihabitans flavidus TaxID=569882 RepID=A0A1H8MD33_9RHOB|nr:ETC complex I subunit [Salinihabitans flavidus]SEO15204.1 ETC complex I subunit conserved region [Salinihabitans flavidus]